MLKIEEISQLIKLIDQSSIQHFELKSDSSKIIIAKNHLFPVKPANAGPAAGSEVHTGESFATEPGIDGQPEKNIEPAIRTAAPETSELQAIVSSMAGTFYTAPEPGAAPFVKIGQKVGPDTVVCILEAMKLFSEVEAGISGEIVEILVKNEQPVEYGQPLFMVKTA